MENKPIVLKAEELIEFSKCLNFSLPQDHNTSCILNGSLKYLSFNDQAQLNQVIIGEPSSYYYGDFLKASNLNSFKEVFLLNVNTDVVFTLIIDTKINLILTLEMNLPQQIFSNLNITQMAIGRSISGNSGNGGARWP